MKSVAMAVDQAAEAAEEMAEDLASKLPEGSKLKEAACFVECVAHEVEKDAELTLAFVEKVSKTLLPFIGLSSSPSVAALISEVFILWGDGKDFTFIWYSFYPENFTS